jgi:hypothetical protein
MADRKHMRRQPSFPARVKSGNPDSFWLTGFLSGQGEPLDFNNVMRTDNAKTRKPGLLEINLSRTAKPRVSTHRFSLTPALVTEHARVFRVSGLTICSQ